MSDVANETILLVDDDFDFLNQLDIQLSAEGYNIITAEGQKAAEKILEDTCPDLAILDLMMEHQDGGFALAFHIKKKYANVPVIIVSGVNSETSLKFDASTDEERTWVKADVFLSKPIRFEQLLKEVQRLIKG
ncbi:response regulator [bacterium]|nr:response regulator [bacterium]